MEVTKTIDNFGSFSRSIKLLAETRVMVGVPSTKTDRSDGPINNAQLMYIHENGAPEANIPPRPVIVPAVEETKTEVTKRFEQLGNYALDGKEAAIEKGFQAIGLLVQNAMQQRIVSGPFIPLKPATLAARKRDGFRGTKPLIRTGKLKASLTYVIRKIPWVGK